MPETKIQLSRYYSENGPTFMHTARNEADMRRIAHMLISNFDEKELSHLDIDIHFECSLSYSDLQQIAGLKIGIGDIINSNFRGDTNE